MDSTLCPTCGVTADPDARACPSCGTPLRPPDDDALLAHVRSAVAQEFDIVREIGRGGMAAVYLALDLRLPRKVALKVMLPELAYAESMPQRFLGEARLAAMLDHPNIVPIYRAGESGGIRYFAMRYIDGCSLEQLLRVERRLPISLSCYILADTARALDFAHGEGIVHRDVKPGNVMLDRRWGRAIVTDFGIAKLTHAEAITRTGFAIGTPAYMSPELCRGASPSSATDQYALGVVAYQLLTGSPPFVGTELDVQMAQLRDVPRPIRDVYPECPAELEAAVLRMLEKAPEARWPCLGDVLSVLLRHVGGSEAAQQEELRRRLTAIIPARDTSVTPPSPMPSRSLTPNATAARVDDVGATNAPPTPTPTPRPDGASGRVSVPASLTASLRALVITPADASVAVGATTRFDVQGIDASGRPVTGLLVAWSTDDPLVAAVSGHGAITALAAGATRVVARVAGHEAAAVLRVETTSAEPLAPPDDNVSSDDRAAASLAVLPARVQLRPGATARLRAVAMTATGEVLDDVTLTWQATDPNVAAVDARGVVRALASGTAEVVVTLDGLSARTEVVVPAAPTAAAPPPPPDLALPAFPPPVRTAVWPRGAPREPMVPDAPPVDVPERTDAAVDRVAPVPAVPEPTGGTHDEASSGSGEPATMPDDDEATRPALETGGLTPPVEASDDEGESASTVEAAPQDEAHDREVAAPAVVAAGIEPAPTNADPAEALVSTIAERPVAKRRWLLPVVGVVVIAGAAGLVAMNAASQRREAEQRAARLRADSVAKIAAARAAADSADSASARLQRDSAQRVIALATADSTDSARARAERDSIAKANARVTLSIVLPNSAPRKGALAANDTATLFLRVDTAGRGKALLQGGQVAWTSSDPAVLSFSRGVARTGRAGIVTVTAAFGAQRSSRQIAVENRSIEPTRIAAPAESTRGGSTTAALNDGAAAEAADAFGRRLVGGPYDEVLSLPAGATPATARFRDELLGWLKSGDRPSVARDGSASINREENHVRFTLVLERRKKKALGFIGGGVDRRVVALRGTPEYDRTRGWHLRDVILTDSPKR